MRFKSTYGRMQHICAKHPDFGINEPESRPDDDTNGNHRPRAIDSSPSSHTSQLNQGYQADEHMVIDSYPPPILSDDFLQPTMAYSTFSSPLPVTVLDDLLPQAFSTSQSPAIHPHDGVSDVDDIESIGHSSSQSNPPFFNDSSPVDTADESATSTCTFTDYHLILNGKFIRPISSVLYSTD